MPDGLRGAIWLAASWGLAFLFICVSIYDVKRVSPAQFWPWQKIRAEQLSNVSLYNRENCTMWMSCAFLFAVNGVIGVFSRQLSMAMYTMFLFPGSLFLCKRYNRILRKYLIQKE